MWVGGYYLSNMNCVCVCVYFTGRGTNSVMLVIIPFFSFSVRLRESVKLQALHTHLGLCVFGHPEYLHGSPTPFYTDASQGLAHVPLMWMEHGG